MPVAVIILTLLVLLVVITPSDASPSCMSKTEARRHFGSVHIYWHGPNHCWDATPTRLYSRTHAVQRKRQLHEVQRKRQLPEEEPRDNDRPRWLDSRSEMLPDSEAVQTLWVTRWVDIEPSHPLVARWVDFDQVERPNAIETEPGSMNSLRVWAAVAVAAIAIALAGASPLGYPLYVTLRHLVS